MLSRATEAMVTDNHDMGRLVTVDQRSHRVIDGLEDLLKGRGRLVPFCSRGLSVPRRPAVVRDSVRGLDVPSQDIQRVLLLNVGYDFCLLL